MKIHEERDALLEKGERLNAEKRELEAALDEQRLGGAQGDGSADGLRDNIALLEKEREVLREE